jgi:hypothetical protein
MKTPKQLYPSERTIYHPELTACPICGGPLMLLNTLLWDKTVQTLDGVRSVASRPARCADPTCVGASMRLRSLAAQQVALPHSTFGYDVLVRIGWQRQTRCATYCEIHADLTPHILISPSQVRHLYQHAYLPLLACHQRQQTYRLSQATALHGGLVIALDGLAPEGGEPQLWCMRDLLTGLILRCGWLARQDQPAFEGFLQPLRELAWPILALVSDKQRGLLPAIASVLPTTPHQLCHIHYLRNLAEPLAAADSALSVKLRMAVRHELGELLRCDQPPDPQEPGVLTTTGVLLNAQCVAAHDPACPSMPPPDVAHCLASFQPTTGAGAALAPSEHHKRIGADVVTQLLRRTRFLLTLSGRPPLRLAGLESYTGLHDVLARSQRLLAHRHDEQLAQLVGGLHDALEPFGACVAEVQVGAGWLARISTVLAASPEPVTSAEQVADQLQRCLDQLASEPVSPALEGLRQHVQKVSRSYWPGLFHCYDNRHIPRTNNEMESLFRDTQRRVLRSTGQKGRTRRILHRSGAWELFGHPPSEAASLEALRQIAPSELADERQRMRLHAQRFRLHTRSARQTTARLNRLEQQWLDLPPTSTA